MSKKKYEYAIIGSGIAGCSVAYYLSKYSNSVVLIDRNCDVAQGASGAAGAFLSALLGKPNKFKDLVTKALKYSTAFYKDNIPSEISNCGTVRIPKNNEDKKKFESYIPYMDFPFIEKNGGYFFEIGSQVNPYNICKFLSKDIQKIFNFEVENIKKEGDFWILNDEIIAKKLIFCTGADTSLIEEDYFNIRAVWGQKIDIHTTTCIAENYHKECSVSSSKETGSKNRYLVSIGATHHRFTCDPKICNHCIKRANINEIYYDSYNENSVNSDTKKLLRLANDIIALENVEVCDIKIGARASSVDYFPLVGELVDSKKTIEKYPHLKNGSHIKNHQLLTHDNIFVLNGVGGRGFVLSLYLANCLVEYIEKNNFLDESITTHRMFKRWVKKSN